MPAPHLVALDLDGVLIDGMAEYWVSSRTAAIRLGAQAHTLPHRIHAGFRRLRPLVHSGWEMVLLVLALARNADEHRFLEDYPAAQEYWQRRLDLSAPTLQAALEEARDDLVRRDRGAWLGLHHFYPGVEARLRRFAAENADWVVVTTKGHAFAAELLRAADLTPLALFGREDGPKPRLLEQLLRDDQSLDFVEDRLPTLEKVRAHSSLDRVQGHLAAWGYLRSGDAERLRSPLHWLTLPGFCAPLADWPGPRG